MGKRISENCVVIFALFFETSMPNIYNEEIYKIIFYALFMCVHFFFFFFFFFLGLCKFFFFFFFFFSGLSNFMFSTFYFGKLVSWWLAFNLFSVFHEFFIKYHYNIYICFLYKCHLVIIIFYIYKNSVFTNVSKNMLPQNFWVN